MGPEPPAWLLSCPHCRDSKIQPAEFNLTLRLNVLFSIDLVPAFSQKLDNIQLRKSNRTHPRGGTCQIKKSVTHVRTPPGSIPDKRTGFCCCLIKKTR